MKKVFNFLKSKPKFHDFISLLHEIYISNVLSIPWTLLANLKFKLLGVTFGKNMKCHRGIDLRKFPLSKITLDDNISIISSSRRCSSISIKAPTKIQTLTPRAKITLKDNIGLNGTSISCRSTSIYIGNNAMFGPNVNIVDSDFHAIMPPETRCQNPGFERDKPVKIKDNVWVGMNVTILKGVTIGRNSIIGACSVVTKDIPENTMAFGVPAKKIKCLSE